MRKRLPFVSARAAGLDFLKLLIIGTYKRDSEPDAHFILIISYGSTDGRPRRGP